MPRKSKTDQEIGYARSAWEERLDLEAEFKGAVTVMVTPEHRIGVWKIRMVYTVPTSDLLNPLDTLSIAVIWPNGHEQSFMGCIWDCFIKLRAMVEEHVGLIQQRAPRNG